MTSTAQHATMAHMTKRTAQVLLAGDIPLALRLASADPAILDSMAATQDRTAATRSSADSTTHLHRPATLRSRKDLHLTRRDNQHSNRECCRTVGCLTPTKNCVQTLKSSARLIAHESSECGHSDNRPEEEHSLDPESRCRQRRHYSMGTSRPFSQNRRGRTAQNKPALTTVG